MIRHSHSFSTGLGMTANLDKCIEKLFLCELLSEKQIKYLCHSLKQELLTSSNVCQVQTPVTVVGDVHGFVAFVFVLVCLIC